MVYLVFHFQYFSLLHRKRYSTWAKGDKKKIFLSNSLLDVSRAKYKIPEDAFLIMVGNRKNECGGSAYYSLYNELGANIPKPDLKQVSAQIHALLAAAEQQLILAAHDIADGGIVITIVEMCLNTNIGIEVDIPGPLSLNRISINESASLL